MDTYLLCYISLRTHTPTRTFQVPETQRHAAFADHDALLLDGAEEAGHVVGGDAEVQVGAARPQLGAHEQVKLARRFLPRVEAAREYADSDKPLPKGASSRRLVRDGMKKARLERGPTESDGDLLSSQRARAPSHTRVRTLGSGTRASCSLGRARGQRPRSSRACDQATSDSRLYPTLLLFSRACACARVWTHEQCPVLCNNKNTHTEPCVRTGGRSVRDPRRSQSFFHQAGGGGCSFLGSRFSWSACTSTTGGIDSREFSRVEF